MSPNGYCLEQDTNLDTADTWGQTILCGGGDILGTLACSPNATATPISYVMIQHFCRFCQVSPRVAAMSTPGEDTNVVESKNLESEPHRVLTTAPAASGAPTPISPHRPHPCCRRPHANAAPGRSCSSSRKRRRSSAPSWWPCC